MKHVISEFQTYQSAVRSKGGLSYLTQSGIYVARIKSNEPTPVTPDRRYVETCAWVDPTNVKVGKARNLAARHKNYWKDFDWENVEYIPIALVEDIQQAETAILRHLKSYRKRSPKGGLMDWLENIEMDVAILEALQVLKAHGIPHEVLGSAPKVRQDSGYFQGP